MTEKLITLKKLQALAERGSTAGERAAARNLLDKLLEKYGLFEEDLKDERRSECEFNYNTKFEKRLLLLLSCAVADNYDKKTGDLLWARRYHNSTRMIFKLTVAEEKQMQVWYAMYKKQWKEEVSRLQKAFIQKHHLTIMVDADSDIEIPEMSREEIYRMMTMMDAMEFCPRHLSLNTGGE